MKFDELDDRMRVFETAHDLCVLPGLHMVARLDGRSFTRLTKEVHPFEAPFDTKFRDLMLATAEHLMAGCGFNIVYGYTQSDEISLLFALEENSFGRKLRKLVSVLSGEASAKFSLSLGALAVFDCRISQLPSVDLVVDYFRWRNEDAHRNALNAHGYWRLRKQGKSVGEATAAMKGCQSPRRTNCFSKAASTSTTSPCGRSGARACTGRNTNARPRTQSPGRRQSPDGSECAMTLSCP